MTNETLLWIPLLPLLGALVNLVFGRWMPRGLVHFVAVTVVAASFGVVVSLVAGPLWDLFDGKAERVELLQHVFWWIEVGDFKVDLAFRLDTLSAVMCLVITGVGTLIHIYSTGYMAEEPRYAAYFGYLNLFTGAMLILVLGSSLPVMFIGWEGVGVCSYLLIGFWFTRTDYADAGRKAFVVNRIGDFAFLLGMFLLWLATKDLGFAQSLDFGNFRDPRVEAELVAPFWGGDRMAAAACILLFIGACGKSAQIPLYVWLPDAMAGPTPVSALIHAATMVTAGVYMIARLSWVFALSTTALAVVATIGLLTALVAAFMAFAQTDLKKVLAYSTVSQLGFMFVGVGTGNWVPAIFHLMTHAFFKAGLFLGAGSVMHANSGSGDIMKMGGLRKHLPITHACFLIYCLAISGFPLTSGFFSKDELLAGALGADGMDGWPMIFNEILWGGLLLAALGTAVYMWRLYFLVFGGTFRGDDETRAHLHESPASMTIPLVVLAVLSIVGGYIGLPHLDALHGIPGVFHGLATWLSSSVDMATAAHAPQPELWMSMGLATLVGLLGIGIAYALWGRGPSRTVERFVADPRGHKVYEASAHKLWVDELYDRVFVRPFRWLARGLFEFVDRFLIDTVLVNGSAFAVGLFGRVMRWIQNGQVQRYMVGLILGAALIFWWTSRAERPAIEYRRTPDGAIELSAYPGAGIASRTAKLRWDLQGDGQWDLRPEALDRIASLRARGMKASDIKIDPLRDYVDDEIVVRRAGEVGPVVRLMIEDAVTGETKVISTHIKLDEVK